MTYSQRVCIRICSSTGDCSTNNLTLFSCNEKIVLLKMNCMEVAEGPLSNTLLCTLEKFKKKHYGEDMDEPFLKGEKFQFPDLSGHRDGLELLEAEFIEECYGKDDVIYEHFVYVFELKIKADVCIYPLDDDICEDHLIEKIVRWIVPEDRYNDDRKIINHKIIDSNNTYHTISVILLCEIDFANKVIKSPFHDEVTDKIMYQFITEGVCYSKEKVSKELQGELQKEFDFLAKNTETDFHPNSNSIVRDLVHPSLYLYVNGISVIKESSTYKCVYEAFDFWGRPYESSGYQWLPTQFYISSDSKCKINDYINNLDENKFQQLYVALEKLFQVFLPYFEDVWSYTKAMKVYEEGINPEYFVKEPASFKDKELQVIVKIVEYTLQPNGFYEGVWHAEGMSHENIVMTGLFDCRSLLSHKIVKHVARSLFLHLLILQKF